MPTYVVYLDVRGIHGGMYKITNANDHVPQIMSIRNGTIFNISGLGELRTIGIERKVNYVMSREVIFLYIKVSPVITI